MSAKLRTGESPSGPVTPPSPSRLSAVARTAAGKALRDKAGRSDHARWKKAADRKDPLAILRTEDADRIPNLVPIRYGRMLASPFTFYRGAAGVMAADLAASPATGIRVQACGDCHLMNFGGFATPEGSIIFDINDFDETLPAPWEWDVKRLAASFVLAARSNGFSDAKARDMAVTSARNYRKRMAELSTMDPLSVWHARITLEDFAAGTSDSVRAELSRRIDEAMKEGGSDPDFPKLAEVVGGRLGIRDTPPLIFHPEVSRLAEFEAELCGAYRDTLSEDRRGLFDRYEVVDVAIKVVGIGSVGRYCWIALLMSASNEPLFLQFKQAIASVLEPFAGASTYPHHGQRVAMGRRLAQPAADLFLGWFTAVTTGRHYYVRRLREKQIKPVVETMETERMDLYAKQCGRALAQAHARVGDACMISAYLGNSDKFDEAMGGFSVGYADQTERDHAVLKAAVRQGRIEVAHEA